MLQQILKDMYIDPDVLEALNEDQKKTLFLKMRQEQVRRWTEREEKGQADGRSSEALAAKPKTANRKSVTWLLGRDGDVAVMVIGDSDEPRSARLIGTSLEDKTSPYQLKATLKSILVNKTTAAESGRAVRENHHPKPQTGIHLNLKGNAEEVSCSPPLQPPETTRAPEESKPSVTFYRPHIRVGPAAQRHISVSSPPPASVATPASPASVSTPSPSSSAAGSPSPDLVQLPGLRPQAPPCLCPRPPLPRPWRWLDARPRLWRWLAPQPPASTSASAPAPTPNPAPTPSLALSPPPLPRPPAARPVRPRLRPLLLP
ncbi:SH2 domain-containing protein 4A-like isoform X2 [Osmerus eperlanus]|uniref:SH2 domain-containing protein 4A-like isoform X2 n=1 Tax=Osmerus eperlanus TaxID=29151 RepID=UPI002E1233E8